LILLGDDWPVVAYKLEKRGTGRSLEYGCLDSEEAINEVATTTSSVWPKQCRKQ